MMRCHSSGSSFLIGCALVLAMGSAAHARGEEQVPLTAEGHILRESYTRLLEDLKREITAAAPRIDEEKKTSFMELHGKIAEVPPMPNPDSKKSLSKIFPRMHYSVLNPPYEIAQGKAVIAVQRVLEEAEPFLSSKRMHARLAKCAFLAAATPRGLAEFAQQGSEEKSYVDMLLNDAKLIVEVMELGGAYQGKYGQAMRNYKAILKASKHASDEFHRTWALASSLEHPDGNYVPKGKTVPKAFVEYYLTYEKAYQAGELDPAFPTLPAWERRFIFPFIAVEETVWMRKMMRNYRPDHLRLEDYKWRYCRITRTDVPYTSGLTGIRGTVWADLNLSRMQMFFLEGGICGPRAFTGRAATHAFGIPSRPAPQSGHAAFSHWTPDGWTVVFGAHWTFNSFRGQCGLDFELESRARKKPDLYAQVHRANWLGDAFGENSVRRMQFGVGGGFWKALAFYKKLAIVKDAELEEQELTGSELAESNEPAESKNSSWTPDLGSSETALSNVPQVKLTKADRTITTDAGGIITIPVAACSPATSTEKIRFMKSFDDSFVQMHYSLAGNRPELLKYTVNVPEAGEYAFTARVVSVTVDRAFLIRVNRRSLYEIDVPLSIGEWVDTEPATMDLKAGRNILLFACRSPNKGLSVKHFVLKPVR